MLQAAVSAIFEPTGRQKPLTISLVGLRTQLVRAPNRRQTQQFVQIARSHGLATIRLVRTGRPIAFSSSIRACVRAQRKAISPLIQGPGRKQALPPYGGTRFLK